MSQGITITHSESEAGGRYEARVDGKDGTGELTYSRVSPTRIIANHTGVDERLRGTGVASALVQRLVADARSRGITIVPRCSYVVAQYRRNPDWSDVMEG